MKMIKFWFLVAYLLIVSPTNVKCSDKETALINKLLKNYNPFARPVVNDSLQLDLEIILTLKQIINLDVRKQVLKTKLWLEYYWKDTKLVWKPEEYGNITSVRIPSNEIWNPDILMYNSASKEFDSTYKVNIIVYSDGSCKYGPPGIFTSTCQIDITWFPFDDQNCTMKFGSWTYKLDALNIKVNKTGQLTPKATTGEIDDGFSSDLFEKNGEWVILGVPAIRTETSFLYNNHPETYVDVTYTIMMRRRTLYYFSYLILPCVLIGLMSILGFYFPPETGEKVTLEITILVACVFFLNIVSDMQPPSSRIPLISTYFTCVLIMVACSVVATIFVLNFHHRLSTRGDMPYLTKKIFLQWLPWLLRMAPNGRMLTKDTIMLEDKIEKLKKTDCNPPPLFSNVLDMNDSLEYLPTKDYQNMSCNGITHNRPEAIKIFNGYDSRQNQFCQSGCQNASEWNDDIRREAENVLDVKPQLSHYVMKGLVRKELESILKEIRVITDKIRNEEEVSEVEEEFKFAARVLDRFCLIIFTAYTILLSLAICLRAPHLFVS